MKYTFTMKHESKAPSVKNTAMLYGPKGSPAVSAVVTQGANNPIRIPDTRHTMMPFRGTT